jgi:hypothetical protein
MNTKKALALMACALLVSSCFAQMQMGRGPMAEKGKAELKVAAGSITIDYSRPPLNGRDMLAQLKEGDFWRMGANHATVFTTSVDLSFGSVKVPKGQYSLWLKRVAQDKFELVFNSKSDVWGMSHDASADVYQTPLKKVAQPTSVEKFTIELKDAPKGGSFIIAWGKDQLSAEFQFAR